MGPLGTHCSPGNWEGEAVLPSFPGTAPLPCGALTPSRLSTSCQRASQAVRSLLGAVCPVAQRAPGSSPGRPPPVSEPHGASRGWFPRPPTWPGVGVGVGVGPTGLGGSMTPPQVQCAPPSWPLVSFQPQGSPHTGQGGGSGGEGWFL